MLIRKLPFINIIISLYISNKKNKIPYLVNNHTPLSLKCSAFDSERLHVEFSKVSPVLRNKMSNGLNWLNSQNIDAVLVGGASVIHYLTIFRQFTPDFDFLVEDIENIIKLLIAQSIRYSTLIAANGKDIIGVTIKPFNLDLLDSEKWNPTLNKFAMLNSLKAKVAGIHLPIISPEILCIMKFELGRGKDDKDAFDLLQYGRLNKELYLDAINNLKPSLKTFNDLVTYSNLIQ